MKPDELQIQIARLHEIAVVLRVRDADALAGFPPCSDVPVTDELRSAISMVRVRLDAIQRRACTWIVVADEILHAMVVASEISETQDAMEGRR